MKTLGRQTAVLALVIVAGLTGCGKDWKAEIDSNTSWSGSFGSVTGTEFSASDVAGTGSRTIDLPDDDRICCAFTQTGRGYLGVTIKDAGGGPFHMFAADERSSETNVQGGYADICTEGGLPR